MMDMNAFGFFPSSEIHWFTACSMVSAYKEGVPHACTQRFSFI